MVGFRLVSLIIISIVIAFVHGTIQSLNGNDWMIRDIEGNYSINGTVPGTIHTNLLQAKKIPEPYLGYNDIDLRDLVTTNWIFRKVFNISSEITTTDRITIHFDQIDTVANVTLNGVEIGQTNSMFMAYTFEINKTDLKPMNNELEITFESPVIYAANQSSAYNQTVMPVCPPDVQHGLCHVQFIRKEPCSFSWDWGPAFAPIGIPGDLYLEGENQTDTLIRLESINLAKYDGDQKMWRVDVLLTSENPAFLSQLKFALTNTTWSFGLNTTLNESLVVPVNIPDNVVSRWWPNGYGEQPLYELTVSDHNRMVGSRVLGFRQVELVQDNYTEPINGTSFYFRINGQAIFVKGSNWIPSDAFQERVSDEKLLRLLTSAKLANMNMLRVWGGGIYERDSFYEMADRLGIMLWHDFMFACSLYPVDQPFLTNVENEILYQVKRLQHHPSIVLWSGNNENEAAVAENWYHIPEDQMAKVKEDYRTLYVSTVMAAVQQLDQGENRPFVTSSPSNGQESIKEQYIAANPQDPLYGDVHFYGYQQDSWNWMTYPITRFLSETGIQSLPSLETWQEVTSNQSDLAINSTFLLHREHSENQLTAMMEHIEANLPMPVTNDSLLTFSQLIYLSQIHQAITLKSISDFCRFYSSVASIDPKTSEGNNMGLMYWQINDIWQAPTWSTIEYNLKWKMAHYYVQHMYSPVYPIIRVTPYLPSANDENAKISFYLANDHSDAVQGQMTCSLLTPDRFSVRLSFVYDLNMNSAGVQNVADLSYSMLTKRAGCDDNDPCLVHCTFNGNNGIEIGQTAFLTRPKNYKLYPSDIQIQSINQKSPMDFDIVLTANRPALFVWLEALNSVRGYFSHNGFHMLEPNRIVSFHTWEPMSLGSMNLNVSITTLFDVTMP